jgi:hypothetical protein
MSTVSTMRADARGEVVGEYPLDVADLLRFLLKRFQ